MIKWTSFADTARAHEVAELSLEPRALSVVAHRRSAGGRRIRRIAFE
jgi:hypothetical protein